MINKGQRYLGNDKNGKPIIEFYDIVETPIEPIIYTVNDYDRRVSELITEKYSIDDQLGFAFNNAMLKDANLIPLPKKEEYLNEYYIYQQFREECKKKARIECGVK